MLFTPVPYFMVYDVTIAQWLCGWNILRVQTQLRDGKHLESKCVGFSSLFPPSGEWKFIQDQFTQRESSQPETSCF